MSQDSPPASGALSLIRPNSEDLVTCYLISGYNMPSSYYELRITGVVPREALLDFEQLTASVEPVQTLLHGPLPDQAALRSLLARLEIFGARIVGIRVLPPRTPPGAPPAE